MIYTPPLYNGKPYFIPIVVKNKDFLVGHLNGVSLIEYTLLDALKNMNVNLDLKSLDLFLDSSRFNDVMEDGRREHELSDEEKKKNFMEIFSDKIDKINNVHEDENTEYNDILRLECQCGYGYYSWDNYEKIPTEQFKCSECGRVLIDYTGNNDEEFEFDDGGYNNENSKKG